MPDWTRIKKTLGRAGERAAVVGGVTVGILGATKAFQAISGPIEFRKDFNAMMDFDKSLKSHDRDQVEARFRTLRTFNKDMSQDPLVAASFVKQTLEVPHLPPTLIADIVKAEPARGMGARDVAKTVSSMIPHGEG